MKILILITIIVFSAAALFAQKTTHKDTLQRVISGPPRFSIIQSTIAVKATFKLDSYTGDVYQLVVNSENRELWQLLKRLPGLFDDKCFPNHCNYNIFVSTLGVRFTYLINVNTGATWQFVVDSKTNENLFEPMDINF